jgi:hypothetical protein
MQFHLTSNHRNRQVFRQTGLLVSTDGEGSERYNSSPAYRSATTSIAGGSAGLLTSHDHLSCPVAIATVWELANEGASGTITGRWGLYSSAVTHLLPKWYPSLHGFYATVAIGQRRCLLKLLHGTGATAFVGRQCSLLDLINDARTDLSAAEYFPRLLGIGELDAVLGPHPSTESYACHVFRAAPVFYLESVSDRVHFGWERLDVLRVSVRGGGAYLRRLMHHIDTEDTLLLHVGGTQAVLDTAQACSSNIHGVDEIIGLESPGDPPVYAQITAATITVENLILTVADNHRPRDMVTSWAFEDGFLAEKMPVTAIGSDYPRGGGSSDYYRPGPTFDSITNELYFGGAGLGHDPESGELVSAGQYSKYASSLFVPASQLHGSGWGYTFHFDMTVEDIQPGPNGWYENPNNRYSHTILQRGAEDAAGAWMGHGAWALGDFSLQIKNERILADKGKISLRYNNNGTMRTVTSVTAVSVGSPFVLTLQLPLGVGQSPVVYLDGIAVATGEASTSNMMTPPTPPALTNHGYSLVMGIAPSSFGVLYGGQQEGARDWWLGRLRNLAVAHASADVASCAAALRAGGDSDAEGWHHLRLRLGHARSSGSATLPATSYIEAWVSVKTPAYGPSFALNSMHVAQRPPGASSTRTVRLLYTTIPTLGVMRVSRRLLLHLSVWWVAVRFGDRQTLGNATPSLFPLPYRWDTPIPSWVLARGTLLFRATFDKYTNGVSLALQLACQQPTAELIYDGSLGDLGLPRVCVFTDDGELLDLVPSIGGEDIPIEGGPPLADDIAYVGLQVT